MDLQHILPCVAVQFLHQFTTALSQPPPCEMDFLSDETAFPPLIPPPSSKPQHSPISTAYLPAPCSPHYHASCINSVPRHLNSSLHSLLTALTLSNFPSCAIVGHITSTSLISHVNETLNFLHPLLSCLPHPLRLSLSNLPSLKSLSTTLSPFPISSNPPWFPPIGPLKSHTSHISLPPLSQRLVCNLETTWDATLNLQRRYRGDLETHPPGTFQNLAAMKAFSNLHPANMDAYAARLLTLASSTLSALDTQNSRLKQLDKRLRAADSINDVSGVVLHRMPVLVRDMFSDPSHAFFLELISGLDSTRLNAALKPRLAFGIKQALRMASGATSNAGFSEAVLKARLFAKLLCVVMNGGNWAHSEASMSGGGEGRGLGKGAMEWRVGGCDAIWTAVLEIGGVLKSALEGGGILGVLGSLAVADVVVKLCEVDPIVREGEWFRAVLEAVKGVKVVGSEGRRIVLVDYMVGEMVEGDGGFGVEVGESMEMCAGIGDEIFVAECCTSFQGIRKLIKESGKKNLKKANEVEAEEQKVTRRITPVAATVEEMKGNGVEDLLKNEFLRRMDGRLRELIGVVACSRGGDMQGAERAYVEVAKVLYPEAVDTVLNVAAKLCAERVKSIGGEQSGKIGNGLRRGKAKVEEGKADQNTSAKKSETLKALEKRLGGNNSSKAGEGTSKDRERVEILEQSLAELALGWGGRGGNGEKGEIGRA